MKKPMLYITWHEDGKEHKIGAFHTISFDGFDVLTHRWVAYKVQTKELKFERVAVPCYHTIKTIEI